MKLLFHWNLHNLKSNDGVNAEIKNLSNHQLLVKCESCFYSYMVELQIIDALIILFIVTIQLL